jgi:hypothetical protein
MPRYFFTIHRQDRVEDDPDGTYLPDAKAALSYADYTIRELRRKSGYKDDLTLIMIVEDQAREAVLFLPSYLAARFDGLRPILTHCGTGRPDFAVTHKTAPSSVASNVDIA